MVFQGSFSPSIFFVATTYIIIPTLVIIYLISQHYGHEKPFPHCWISKVAEHYPEYVFFRSASIPGAVLVVLGWMGNYFFLLSLAKEKVFNIRKYHPEVCVVLGTMGAIFLMGSTATIDSGRMNENLHELCARSFFVCTLVAQAYNTVICTILHQNTGAISQASLITKYVLFVLLLVQLIASTTGDFWEEYESPNSRAQFLEWTLTATVILGFYSIGRDCRKFSFVYELLS